VPQKQSHADSVDSGNVRSIFAHRALPATNPTCKARTRGEIRIARPRRRVTVRAREPTCAGDLPQLDATAATLDDGHDRRVFRRTDHYVEIERSKHASNFCHIRVFEAQAHQRRARSCGLRGMW
jgi:hypothetical protein